MKGQVMQHKTPIGTRANGRWKEILPAIGVSADHLTGKHGPCPVCGGKDRFRFDDKGGAGTWFCSQSHGTDSSNARGSAGNGFALVMDIKRCEFAEAARLVEEVIGAEYIARQTPKAEDDTARTQKLMRELWQTSQRLSANDPVDLYLRGRVGSYRLAGAIRFAPQCRHSQEHGAYPAMIARITDRFGDGCGIHRTYLDTAGRKASVDPVRKVMGSMPDGCAVRLMEHGKTLGIAEGIETALAAARLYNLPVWAALNAGRLGTWTPPEGVSEVVVFGDNDVNYTGQDAAYSLAKRLSETVTVQVALPPDPGMDWNDVLLARPRAA